MSRAAPANVSLFTSVTSAPVPAVMAEPTVRSSVVVLTLMSLVAPAAVVIPLMPLIVSTARSVVLAKVKLWPAPVTLAAKLSAAWP